MPSNDISKKQRIVGELPEQIVVLNTNPRSGSTWLLDSLRCHPAIIMHPRTVIYEKLNLKGRRYPKDLFKNSDLKIEVVSGKWEAIPDFQNKNAQKYVSQDLIEHPYCIEKIHPHFYDHDIRNFLKSISTIRQNSNVKLIYQVRDPISSMVSFLRYQKRNLSWNKRIKKDQLPNHMKMIYDSLYYTALECPGLVVDYSKLMNNYGDTLLRILDFLWPNELPHSNNEKDKLINLITDLTARDKRKKTGTSFLGKKVGSTSGNDGKYQSFFSEYKDEIQTCYQPYHSLLNLRPKNN